MPSQDCPEAHGVCAGQGFGRPPGAGARRCPSPQSARARSTAFVKAAQRNTHAPHKQTPRCAPCITQQRQAKHDGRLANASEAPIRVRGTHAHMHRSRCAGIGADWWRRIMAMTLQVSPRARPQQQQHRCLSFGALTCALGAGLGMAGSGAAGARAGAGRGAGHELPNQPNVATAGVEAHSPPPRPQRVRARGDW